MIRRARRGAPALLALALTALAPPALARERVVRVYDERDGLAVAEIVALAQDARGFLWIGTTGGLVRFDGAEMRPWAPERLRGVVRWLACAPAGDVIVSSNPGPLQQLTVDAARDLAGPDGAPIADALHAAFDAKGGLWIARPHGLDHRDADGRWSRIDVAGFGGERLFRVLPDRGDSLWIATTRALWRLTPRGEASRVADVPFVQHAVRRADGAAVFLTARGRLFSLDGGVPATWFDRGSSGPALAVRGDVVWATIGSQVLAFRPDRSVEVIAPSRTVATGRPMIVDREGALWIGGFRGLTVLPEPETVAWNDEDGMPAPPHAHSLARDSVGVWVTTWFGAARRDTDRPAQTMTPLGAYSGRFATDGLGGLWSTTMDRGFERWHGRHRTFLARDGIHGVYGAARRGDGTLWLASDDGLFLTPRGAGPPHRVASPPPTAWGEDWTDAWTYSVLEDSRGALWLSRGESIAMADAESLAAGHAVAWRVDSIPAAERITALLEITPGSVWASTGNRGVFRRAAAGWEPIEGARGLASPRVYGMGRSPLGGVWVLANGDIVRVVERRDRPEGWEVLERLTTWHGMPTQQAGDVHEDLDGRMWLASLAGLIEVPPQARRAELTPPRVELVDLLVDGRRLPVEPMPMLPYRRNRLELRFAALSFRDRSLVRYQIRLREGQPWIETRDPSFRFVDLTPGRYGAEIRASLDGVRWSERPAHVAFQVHRPWWLEPWAIAAALAMVAALAYAAHRIRVGFLLRLERQRTRIAMDLHDEMGSGLGSIGILAGLASDERLDDSSRRRLAGQIAEAAGDLGGSLSEIVGSLRRGSDSLESVAHGLLDRGRRLFPGPSPVFRTEFPEQWPREALPLELRRTLQRVLAEAMHNAARHARASEVTLGFAPDGAGWRAWVADDGVGLTAEACEHGHGLRNMRERAAAIGARLECRGTPGRGTCVSIAFATGRAGRARRSHDRATADRP